MTEFYYSRYIEELKNLFSSMRGISVDIATFDHHYNGIDSMVIFDTRDNWKLVFIKRGLGNTLEIPVERGYKFTVDGNANYKKFREYFQIGGAKGEFSLNEFVSLFKSIIPERYVLNDEKRVNILKYDRIDCESEGIYPIRTINWEEVHAKNPKLDPTKYHRTAKNLEKTKQLYPGIYRATKDMDMTIVYGRSVGIKTEDIKKVYGSLGIK